ncbi:MAG: hypothetical protein ABRQ39_03330 [Candidatus Eremiobacterota bacterium]
MKIKVLLTLLIITLITIAIICGCGGGSGTTQPASLVTPTPDYTDTGTGDTAYITVRVKWPEQGKTGNMRTVSENGKDLTTSMIPSGTKIIDIYVIDYTDNPNNPNVPWDKVVASGNIHEGEIEKTISIPVATKIIGKPTPGAPNQGSTGPPPAIRVKMLAEAFNEFDETHPTSRIGRQVARTDPNTAALRDLKVGNQEAYIFLYPDLEFMMSATETTTARSIIASDTGSSNEYDINANLQLMYGTPFPVSTVIPDTSGEISEPMEGQTVKFKVIQGSGQLDAIQAQTDPNGDCKVHFTSTSAYNVIEASYQYDPDDPNTIVTSQCTIGENYELTLPASLENTLGNITSISATLQIKYPPSDPNNPASAPAPKPVVGKPIKFEIKTDGLMEGNGHFSGSQTDPHIIEAVTDQDGNCSVDFIGDTAGDVKIEGTFQANQDVPPTTALPCIIHIKNLQSSGYLLQMSSIDNLAAIPQDGQIDITALLLKNIYGTYPPVQGATITFRIKSKDGIPWNGNALSPLTATTDLDGKCSVLFTGTETGSYEIEAEFKDIHSDGTYTSYTGSLSIEVTNGLIWKEDFESYEPYTWPEPVLWLLYNGSPGPENCIVPFGSGQGLKMFQSHVYYLGNFTGTYKSELRLTVNNGDDAPRFNGEIIPSYTQGVVGLTRSEGYFIPQYTVNFLSFVYNEEVEGRYKIYGMNGLDLGSYSQNTPYSVIIRFNGDFRRYGSGEIVYFINGTTKSITLDQDSRMRISSCNYLTLKAADTTAWFDNIEFRDRAGLPQNDILKSTNNPLQINNNNL